MKLLVLENVSIFLRRWKEDVGGQNWITKREFDEIKEYIVFFVRYENMHMRKSEIFREENVTFRFKCSCTSKWITKMMYVIKPTNLDLEINPTKNELEKSFQRKHTIKNSDIFDIHETVHDYDYIHCHLEKFDLYLVKHDFKLLFDKKFYPRFKSDLYNTLTIFHLTKN